MTMLWFFSSGVKTASWEPSCPVRDKNKALKPETFKTTFPGGGSGTIRRFLPCVGPILTSTRAFSNPALISEPRFWLGSFFRKCSTASGPERSSGCSGAQIGNPGHESSLLTSHFPLCGGISLFTRAIEVFSVRRLAR